MSIHFFIEIWFFDTQNTFYLIKNAFFIPFLWLSKSGLASRIIPMELGILVVGWKLPFSCVKSVSEHICSLSGVKNTTKKSRKADWKVGGGGSMLTVSLSVKYSFLLWLPLGKLSKTVFVGTEFEEKNDCIRSCIRCKGSKEDKFIAIS